MAKTLFVDLKYRVVEAIAQDKPRRQAAERFGVSISSAIRWYQQYKSTGVIAPKKQGGDRRSGRMRHMPISSWVSCPTRRTSPLLSCRRSLRRAQREQSLSYETQSLKGLTCSHQTNVKTTPSQQDMMHIDRKML